MDAATLQLTCCPQCGGTAEIERRTVLASTDGPIEHARIRCVNRHWFHMPVSALVGIPPVVADRRPAGDRR